MSKQNMREFDELCLTPVRPQSPEEIRDLREREGARQAVFARYLNDDWQGGLRSIARYLAKNPTPQTFTPRYALSTSYRMRRCSWVPAWSWGPRHEKHSGGQVASEFYSRVGRAVAVGR
jgi:hypothetical protein